MLDPSLMEKYFDVAMAIAEQAIVTGPPEFKTVRTRYEFEETATHRAIDYLCAQPSFLCREKDVVVMEGGARTFGKLLYQNTGRMIPVKGMYTVRVRASADPGERGEPIVMQLRRGGEETLMEVEVEATPDNPRIYEVTLPLEARGGNEIGVQLVNGTRFYDYNRAYGDLDRAIREAGKAGDFAESIRLRGLMKATATVGGIPRREVMDISKVPKLILDWIEVEGPVYGGWPPASHRLVMFKPEADASPEYAREIFQRLLPRVYRRPVSEAEVNAIVGLVQDELDHGSRFEVAIRTGVAAALTSPKFLYLHEPSGPQPRRLNDYELASRLSYFLWSSMPDERQRLGIAQAQLHDPEVLVGEVNRMLKDSRSQALIDGFAAQWLRTGQFRDFTPDPRLYPQYNEKLGEAMVQETLAFFREILEHDLSVISFLDADFAMLNEPLAEFYGIPGVTGEQFRPVKLPADSHRGGLLTQAGVLMYGSDGSRTKPVRRGVYVREVLFNDPPDPPPPNVGEIEPNIEGKNLTVRERLLAHQQIESCAACHRTIDPYGLALENYDVIGLWRTQQNGEGFRGRNTPPIVASGKLPGGQTFDTPDEFKALLVAQQSRFLRCLAEKLLIYALGRPLEPSDRSTVDRLAQRCAEQNHSMRALLAGIVTSEVFQTK